MPLGNAGIDDEFCLFLAFEVDAIPRLELDIESRAVGQSSWLDSLTAWFKAGIPTISPSGQIEPQDRGGENILWLIGFTTPSRPLGMIPRLLRGHKAN